VTTYEPYPTVTFGGTTTYADNTISSISIRMGRNDVTEQPQPGFASIELWTDASEPLDVALSQSVSIAIDKGTTGTQQIFYGTISDIDISLQAYGSDGSVAVYSITAIGPLAQLNRRLVGSTNFPKQFDGNRILAILSEAFLTEWDDVSPTLTWAGLPVGATWDSFDAAGQALVDTLVTNVDTPGQYELTAYSNGITDAYTLAVTAANSGRGVLWENGTGSLHYDDYASRANATPLVLTADDLLAQGLRTQAQWGEIVNDVTVSYKANATANARDEQSIILYGQLSGTRSTVLENGSDAMAQANDFLESRAYPRMYPEQLTIPLHSPTVSDATRDALAAVYNGLRVSTEDLPAVFGTTFDGFVEGYTWNLTRYTAELALTCSAYSETYQSIIWYQLPPTTTWAGYTPSTTEWQDL
jgi:hypothetical protein